MLVIGEPCCNVQTTILGRSSKKQDACCGGALYVAYIYY